MKKNMDSIIEQFDFVWGIAPEGTPKHDRGEHIREIIREAHQQGFKEAMEKIEEEFGRYTLGGSATLSYELRCWKDKLTLLDE